MDFSSNYIWCHLPIYLQIIKTKPNEISGASYSWAVMGWWTKKWWLQLYDLDTELVLIYSSIFPESETKKCLDQNFFYALVMSDSIRLFWLNSVFGVYSDPKVTDRPRHPGTHASELNGGAFSPKLLLGGGLQSEMDHADCFHIYVFFLLFCVIIQNIDALFSSIPPLINVRDVILI